MASYIQAVNKEVKGLKTPLAEGFHELKDVLITDGKREKNTRKLKSGDKENIIVAGGVRTNSVEMFNWRQRTWSPLPSMPKNCPGATSFIYNNHMTIAGGYCDWPDIVDDMVRMNVHTGVIVLLNCLKR